MSVVFLCLALVFYSLGLLHSFLTIITRKQKIFWVALAGFLVGFINHIMAIFFAWHETGHPPITNRQEALSFFAALIVLLYLAIYLKYRLSSLSVFLFPLVFILTLTATVMTPSESANPVILHSFWFYIHIPTTFLAYASFFVAFAVALMYLIQERELKRKRPAIFYYLLPSLEICDELGYRALSYGFILLTIGIIAGALWGKLVLIGSWQWDPKILWSAITWLMYAVVVHYRFTAGLRGRGAALLSIAAFIFVLLNLILMRSQGLAHRFIVPY
jgi:cytochrome c-type biogenesis protein CcsB